MNFEAPKLPTAREETLNCPYNHIGIGSISICDGRGAAVKALG